MTDSRRPPVEPLDDLAWTRIERGIWGRIDGGESAPASLSPRSPRRWAPIALALAAAAVLAIIAVRRNEAVLAPPQLLVADGTPARFEAGATPSAVTYGDVYLTLEPHSAVLMSRDPSAPVAILDAGAAWFSVAPRAGKAPFAVLAGDVTVRVVGTRFRVARSAVTVAVNVEHGVVEVAYRGDQITLAAGDTWSSVPGQHTAGSARADGAPPDAATAAPPPPDASAPAPKPPRIDERARFEALAALEVADPRAAIAGYLALARGTSAWSQLALFAAARLAADRQDPRATQLLETYLRRFPRGANADDARELLGHRKER